MLSANEEPTEETSNDLRSRRPGRTAQLHEAHFLSVQERRSQLQSPAALKHAWLSQAHEGQPRVPAYGFGQAIRREPYQVAQEFLVSARLSSQALRFRVQTLARHR